MTTSQIDQRSLGRRARDEQIAAEPRLATLELPSDTPASAVEAHLARYRPRPLALVGVVENGVIRPLDPTVKLPEHSRVIIVATEET